MTLHLVGTDGRKQGLPLDALPQVLPPNTRLMITGTLTDDEGSTDGPDHFLTACGSNGYATLHWHDCDCYFTVVSDNLTNAAVLLQACYRLAGANVAMVLSCQI